MGIKTLVWSLRPNMCVSIELPTDCNQEDIDRMKTLLDLEAELINQKQENQ